jgi:hypothetical protein
MDWTCENGSRKEQLRKYLRVNWREVGEEKDLE